jgi:hypothetical protein
MSGFTAFPTSHAVDYGVDGTPPDYVLIYVTSDPFAANSALHEPVGYTSACAEVTHDEFDHYHGGGPSGGIDSSFTDGNLTCTTTGFVPDSDGAGGYWDGQFTAGAYRPIQGYIVPPSPVYTGDPTNTAADYLWDPDDLPADIEFSITADFNGFHKIFTPVIGIHLLAYWERTRSGFVCLV